MAGQREYIFFDGGCGVCSAGARRWGRLLAAHPIELIPFQAPEADKLLGRNPAEPLPAEMQMLLSDGRLIGGVDVIAEVARRIWWAFPIHLILLVPPLRAIARTAYAWFAKRRRRFSQACGLRPMV